MHVLFDSLFLWMPLFEWLRWFASLPCLSFPSFRIHKMVVNDAFSPSIPQSFLPPLYLLLVLGSPIMLRSTFSRVVFLSGVGIYSALHRFPVLCFLSERFVVVLLLPSRVFDRLSHVLVGFFLQPLGPSLFLLGRLFGLFFYFPPPTKVILLIHPSGRSLCFLPPKSFLWYRFFFLFLAPLCYCNLVTQALFCLSPFSWQHCFNIFFLLFDNVTFRDHFFLLGFSSLSEPLIL